ncbi:uncharacterized protein [Watersipora subatra]|uniref:uncharacterized protein n=1 Tax=Watersipora subatra TaxID=2589382 RepID=UPI00355C1324
MLTFPPHCSHKLQPLDISVYGPLKRYFNDACNSWKLENPGKTLSIYNMAEMLGLMFGRAMTAPNIIAGFCKPGISPFDRHTFSDEEFFGSFVTDRPATVDVVDPNKDNNSLFTTEPPDVLTAVDLTTSDDIPSSQETVSPSSSTMPIDDALPGCSIKRTVTPDQIRPFPKAAPRKSFCNYKRKSTAILTDTPVKEKIAKAAKERANRSHSKIEAKKKWPKKEILPESSDDEKEIEAEERKLAKQLEDKNDDEPISEAEDECGNAINIDSLNISEYVLACVHGKKMTKHFVAVITEVIKDTNEISVDFLKTVGENQFTVPKEKDSATVHIDDIVMLLPTPAVSGGTKRTSERLNFAVDLATYM